MRQCVGETIQKAITSNFPGLRARVETSFALAQGGEVFAVVPSHARLVDRFRHLGQTPRAPRAVARGLARPALTLTRGVVPIAFVAVSLPPDSVNDVLAAKIAVTRDRSGGTFEIREIQPRPRLAVAHWIAGLVCRPPTVKLESDLRVGGSCKEFLS